MKYSQAGIYQVRGWGYMVPLYYGWTILFPNSWDGGANITHNVATRLQLYEKRSGRNGIVNNSICDMRQAEDDNWCPLKLVVFSGYCARFYYWDINSLPVDKFNSGHYDWLDNSNRSDTRKTVHLIHVTLASEGISDFDTFTGKNIYNYNWNTTVFPNKINTTTVKTINDPNYLYLK